MRKRKIRSNNFYTMIGNSLILFIIGLLLVMLVLGQDLLDSLREEFTFQLELEEDLSSDDVDQISSMLRQLAYVDQNSIQYQNKIEIANDFKEDLGISSDDNMLEEALFDAISLKLKSTEINSADIIRAKSDFMKIPLVQRVNHIEDLSKGLFDNMETLRFVGFVLSLVLCLVLTILIYNNTRLSIYSERFKIRKMQLVGALPWIITKPFVKSAIGVAAIAALIAILGIGILLFVSYPQVSSFNMLQAWTILGKVSVFLLVISITISIVSSYVIVNRYLKMDLDDLYG